MSGTGPFNLLENVHGDGIRVTTARGSVLRLKDNILYVDAYGKSSTYDLNSMVIEDVVLSVTEAGEFYVGVRFEDSPYYQMNLGRYTHAGDAALLAGELYLASYHAKEARKKSESEVI